MNFRLKATLRTTSCTVVCCALALSGCDSPPPTEPPKQESIIGKKTQDIGEFDPQGNAQIADLQVDRNSSPIGAAAGALTYSIGKTSELTIQHSLELFRAEHGQYPKDHTEFMEKVIKRNNIQLPVLPGKRRYQYDVENHKLVVVEAESNTEAE